MDKIKILKDISSDLNLDYESQDWGIINSSSHRVNEFIKYFNDNIRFPDIIKYELYELIIASFNDSIIDNNNDDFTTKNFVNFISNNIRYPFIDILNYWTDIFDEDEFPVSKYFPEFNTQDIE